MWKSMRKWEVWESIPISHSFLLFLLPSPGVVGGLLLLPWGYMPQDVPAERPRGRTSHAAPGVQFDSARRPRIGMLTRFWFDSSSVARKGSVGTVTVNRPPESLRKTRSIAPNQGYICRSRPHEGDGDTI